MAMKKFEDSKGVLAFMDKRAEKREIMVPLTSSLYVPGHMDDHKNVLVEVGGGYFIEKDNLDAVDYCERKHSQVKKNSEKVTQLI